MKLDVKGLIIVTDEEMRNIKMINSYILNRYRKRKTDKNCNSEKIETTLKILIRRKTGSSFFILVVVVTQILLSF